MIIVVNKEKRELDYVTASGEDMAPEIIGEYEKLELDNDGYKIMNEEQYAWWEKEFDKMREIDKMESELKIMNNHELYDQYLHDIDDIDLDSQTTKQIEWLENYKKATNR